MIGANSKVNAVNRSNGMSEASETSRAMFFLYIKMSETTYYQRNRDIILNRAKNYYENDKELLRERAKNKYRSLSEGEKDIKNNIKKLDIITSVMKRNKN